jgi:hypothetical protein
MAIDYFSNKNCQDFFSFLFKVCSFISPMPKSNQFARLAHQKYRNWNPSIRPFGKFSLDVFCYNALKTIVSKTVYSKDYSAWVGNVLICICWIGSKEKLIRSPILSLKQMDPLFSDILQEAYSDDQNDVTEMVVCSMKEKTNTLTMNNSHKV